MSGAHIHTLLFLMFILITYSTEILKKIIKNNVKRVKSDLKQYHRFIGSGSCLIRYINNNKNKLNSKKN